MSHPLCDVYHGGLVPPEADIDLRRRRQVVGIPGKVRFLCDEHGLGRVKAAKNPKYRLAPKLGQE